MSQETLRRHARHQQRRGQEQHRLTLGEIFFLEELAAHCAADGRYAFPLVAPPLPVTAAVGTPINPYALK